MTDFAAEIWPVKLSRKTRTPKTRDIPRCPRGGDLVKKNFREREINMAYANTLIPDTQNRFCIGADNKINVTPSNLLEKVLFH
jgi:hypothetical protein